MDERSQLQYAFVLDDSFSPSCISGEPAQWCPRYNRTILQSTLQLMGCKPRHARKISYSVFGMLLSELELRAAGRTHSVLNNQLSPNGFCQSVASAGLKGSEFFSSKQVEKPITSGANTENATQTAACSDSRRFEHSRELKGKVVPESRAPHQILRQLQDTDLTGRTRDGPNSVGRFHSSDCRVGEGSVLNTHGETFHSAAAGGALDTTRRESQGVPADWQPTTADSSSARHPTGLPSLMLKEADPMSVWITRRKFNEVVCEALSNYNYRSPLQEEDLTLACRVREHRRSVTVLLCGTSGCGKSTLASLLASRLGITTVVSTDSIRHMMRSFVSAMENPLLWASTYHAGECLDAATIMTRRRSKAVDPFTGGVLQHPGSSPIGGPPITYSLDGAPDATTTKATESDISRTPTEGSSSSLSDAGGISGDRLITVKGFKAQSEMVMESLDRLIGAYEGRGESLVVEGVHLSLNFVMGLMRRHPSVIPFLVYISDEAKHMERFAVRARYMALDSARNKYVKYIRNIRAIQDYLVKRADKHLVPKVNNTNVDKSVAAIHATVFSCLRRQEGGEMLLDDETNTVKVVYAEYKAHVSNTLDSKNVLRLIRLKGSHNSLLAVLNGDVAVVPRDAVTVESSSVPSSSGAATPLDVVTRLCSGEDEVGGMSEVTESLLLAGPGESSSGAGGCSPDRLPSPGRLRDAAGVELSKMFELKDRGRVAESDSEDEAGDEREEGSDAGDDSGRSASGDTVPGSVAGSDDDESVSGETGGLSWIEEEQEAGRGGEAVDLPGGIDRVDLRGGIDGNDVGHDSLSRYDDDGGEQAAQPHGSEASDPSVQVNDDSTRYAGSGVWKRGPLRCELGSVVALEGAA